MAGRIKEIIDQIIQERSKGNAAIAEMTIAKLILKGLNPNKFNSYSDDDPKIINKLLTIAKQLNVTNLVEPCTSIKSVYSVKCLEEEIVGDIKKQLSDCNTKLLVYFASSYFDQEKLSNLFQHNFTNSIVVGCSTAGEIGNGALLSKSVVAMSIDSNIISDLKVEVIDHINEIESVDSAFTSFEKYFNEDTYTMDTTKYLGMVLIDGVSMKEEIIMDLIGNKTNVFFVGGTAGDDLKFIRTYVCHNGNAYSDKSILVMMKINDNAEFDVIKTQSFRALDKTLVASKVNKGTREVIEFNEKPAIEAYSEAVGADSIEDVSQYFTLNPLGIFIGENNIFVRSPQQVKGTSMIFYSKILEGMEVKLLKSTDIINDTKKAIQDKIGEFGHIDGIISFNCIQRINELKKKNLEAQYAEIFKDIPTIGFSTYGELLIGHINQTATMILFKQKNKK